MGFFVGAAMVLFVGAAVGFVDVENFVGATAVESFLGYFSRDICSGFCRFSGGGFSSELVDTIQGEEKKRQVKKVGLRNVLLNVILIPATTYVSCVISLPYTYCRRWFGSRQHS
jgi:hypothetical protein